MANEYCYLVLIPRQGGNPPERWEKSTRLSLDDAQGEAAKWKARGFKTQVVHDITAEEMAGREKCGRCEHVRARHTNAISACRLCKCSKFVTAEEYKAERETVKKVEKEAADKKKHIELGLGDRCRCDHAKSMHDGRRHGGRCKSNAGCVCPKFKLRGAGKVKKKAVKEIMSKGLPPLDIKCDHKGGDEYNCDECRGVLYP